MKFIYQVIFVFGIVLLSLNLQAQPGAVDLSFNPGDTGYGTGTNGTIYSTAIQMDGKIVLAGNFTKYKNNLCNNIARLNSDGTFDGSFNSGSGSNGEIYSMLLQPDGKIIIAGEFTVYNGTTARRIARINTDGTIDPLFISGSGFDNYVTALCLQTDGKIIVAGDFYNYKGAAARSMVRINNNGSRDTSFNIGNGPDDLIHCIHVQNDGKILVGGAFYEFNGSNRVGIVRLNSSGVVDYSFNPGTGVGGWVDVVTTQPDNKILIGGNFNPYNGVYRSNIARINPDGTLDTTFDPGFVSYQIATIKVLPDSSLIVSGGITMFNSVKKELIVRVFSNGTVDTTFNKNDIFYPSASYSYSTSIQSDGKIIVAGSFSEYDDIEQNNIARLNSDGSLDLAFNEQKGVGISVKKIWIQPDSKLMICGNFGSYFGYPIGRIARLHPDGERDTSFNNIQGANMEVRNVLQQPDGKYIITGGFTKYDNVVRGRIARINSNGSLDTTFNSAIGVNGDIYDSVLQPDGKIIIVGNFQYNGNSSKFIARVKPDGTMDTGFNIGTGTNTGPPTAVNLQPDGKIIIGGTFTKFNGVNRKNIARLNSDGSLDMSFNPGTGPSAQITKIELQPDNKIIIGGGFTSYNGIQIRNIARLNPDGSLDPTLNSYAGLNSWFTSLKLLANGKILIAGYFTSYNGISVPGIFRVNSDGNVDLTFNSGSGPDSVIYAIATQNNGDILVGGLFKSINGIGRNRLARLFGGVNSIHEFYLSNDIKVYPNPCNGTLNLDFVSDNFKSSDWIIELSDISGRKCFASKLVSERSMLELGHLSPGAYLIRVRNGHEMRSGKIIITE